MKLEFIEIAGFRGFRDKTKFEFPSGFAVLTGRNGVGKSSVLDAVDFALTGTISKFPKKGSRGGGIDEHIWWVENGKPEEYYVTIGFIKDNGERFVLNRSRERGCDIDSHEIVKQLCIEGASANTSIDTLIETTLIRDELISVLSLELPEQTRFQALKAAIGGIVGPDYTERTAEIHAAATSEKNKQDDRINDTKKELGRLLEDLTVARSVAERSTDISKALEIIESLSISLPSDLTDQLEALRKLIVDKKLALQQIESARIVSQEIQKEITYFNLPSTKAEIESSRIAQENALREKTLADQRLKEAMRIHAEERQRDEYVSHMAAILEHGAALGLQEGHCPLCDALRTTTEFEAAIASTRAQLATQGEKLEAASNALNDARKALSAAEQLLSQTRSNYAEIHHRQDEINNKVESVRAIYDQYEFNAPPEDPKKAEELILAEQENLIILERAIANLEASNAIDRVKNLEARIAKLRERSDQETAKLNSLMRVVESARQINSAAKTVVNDIVTEQVDTVTPLLKELFRRLRPHANWIDIEPDFGGKVRRTLNLTVGGHDPQFLFSSGQRRAAGLAFLLAVHMSRPWCNWHSLLLDDPVQHIDDYRALHLVEVLSAIRRTGRQIIVAVEDQALANLLCRRLLSAKDDIGRMFELNTSKSGTSEILKKHDIYPMPQSVLKEAQG